MANPISLKCMLPVIIAAVFVACDQSVKGRHGEVYRSATEYNNYIIDRQKRVGLFITLFYRQLNTNLDSAGIILQKGLFRVNEALDEIKNMPPYKGDSSFRHAAINSFNFYKKLFEIDYPVILSLHNRNQPIREDDQQTVEKILNQIIKQEDQYDKELHNRQRDFADRNHMKLSKEGD